MDESLKDGVYKTSEHFKTSHKCVAM